MALEKTIRIKVDSSKAERNVNSLDRSMNNLDGSASKTNKSFGALKTTVIAVAAALQAGAILKYADAFTSAQNQIRQTVTTTQQLTQRTSELFNVAQRSRTEFGATAELYTQLNLSTENLNLSTSNLTRITETISKTFAISGKTAEESAGAIRQLGQAFASGTLRGDEFISVSEGAPEIMRALQRSLGKTMGELREFAATGGITSKILVDALAGAADVIDEKFNNTTKTFAQFTQEAENNAILFVGSSEAITGSVNLAGEAILGISQNLELLADVALIGAIAGFGRLSSAVILSTVETVKNTVANASNLTSVKLLSNGIGGTTKRIVAMTAAQKAATVASVSLNRVMGLLGGPVGLAITAASAVAFFALSASDAADDAKRLASDVDDLAASFSGLNEQQIAVKLQNAVNESNRLVSELAEASAEMNRMIELNNKGIFVGTVEWGRQKKLVEELTAELAKAELKAEALFQTGLGVGRTPEEGTGAKSEEPQQIDSEDNFVNSERFKTESLRAELLERQTIQKAYNDVMVGEFQSLADQEQAIVDFNKAVNLASLETRKLEAELEFQERRDRINEQTKVLGFDKLALLAEIEAQERTQQELFELEKNRIAQEAAEARLEISRLEGEERAAINVQAADLIREVNQRMVSDSLSFFAQFGSKSKTLAKAILVLRAAEGASSAIINSQVAATRALAELGPIKGTPVAAKMITYGKVSAGIIAANAALSLGGGGGSGGASISSFGGGGSESETATRQEPISQQSNIEFRGLSEIAELLSNLDPDEVLPVEYTQRIVASLGEYERLSGGG